MATKLGTKLYKGYILMSHRWLTKKSGKERLQKNGGSAGLDIGALCAIAYLVTKNAHHEPVL